MSQAPRSASGSVRSSDDLLENATAWLQANAKTLALGLGGVVIAGVAIYAYRSMDATKREKATAALYQAQAPLSEGRLGDASTELQKVAQRYGGTPAAQQATMLAAQAMFEQGQYAEGIALLEKARGSANRDFAAAMEGLIAAGHEGLGDMAKAAEHYGKAAQAAQFESERSQFKAAQGRSLMSAGRRDEAAKIWQEFAANEASPFAQEARVRLGEIAALANR